MPELAKAGVNMARVVIDGNKLVVQMGILERIQTATSRYEVPMQNVLGVETGRAQTAYAGSFSTGIGLGLGVGVKMPLFPFGGRVSSGNGKMLVAFRNPGQVVTISLKHDAYDKIIVQVDDKERIADEIRKAISSA
jgi:hypothetical protein